MGCALIEEVTLSDPDDISASVQFDNSGCEGLATGVIQVSDVAGGVGPYQTSLNGEAALPTLNYNNLNPGSYTLTVQDANGCTLDTISDISAPQIPELSGVTSYTTQLGCEITIETEVNDVDIDQIFWVDTSFLNCSNCLSPVATPPNSGQNILIVSSIDGCLDSLIIDFQVEKLRQFYAPNIFSPNGDMTNDIFALSGGKEVASIDLYIYDRWGSLLYLSLIHI